MKLAALADQIAQVSDIYAERFNIRRDADWALLKIQEELGELTAEHLRLSGRARGQADETALANEAADVLGMLLLYCRRHGVDLEAAVERKWLCHLETA